MSAGAGETVFDQPVHVHYCQIYVESEDGPAFGYDDPRAGQVNGLCGAAVAGALFLVTGLHTGDVGFRVEVHDCAPPVADEREEVVEASFRPVSGAVSLVRWAGEACWPLPLTVRDYRVRYSASGMEAAHQQDMRLDGEPLLDRYLLQFWPAPPGPDRVLRQTSTVAAYWHSEAQSAPPPPTPEDRLAK